LIVPDSLSSVVVRVPLKLNLEQSTKILANTLGRLGCGGCLSGFDIRFVNVRDFIVNPKSFEVNDIAELGRQLG
jgi:hypothetical protein